MMDNPNTLHPSTLRRKAVHFFEDAASAPPAEAEKLYEVGRQLQLWADDLEEMLIGPSKDSSKGADPSAPGKTAQCEPTRS
jgi:hypothetical protein